jgi:hypothetical protein
MHVQRLSRLTQTVTLLTCQWEGSSNVNQDSDYSDRDSLRLFSVSPGNRRDRTLNYVTKATFDKSRDNLVGMTGYGLDDQGVGVRVPMGARIFTYPCLPDELWGHPVSYPVGIGGSFRGGKAAGA